MFTHTVFWVLNVPTARILFSVLSGGWQWGGQYFWTLKHRWRESHLLEAKAISSDGQQFIIQRADAGHLHVTLFIYRVWQHAGQARPGVRISFLC